jgi:hypothetical protein
MLTHPLIWLVDFLLLTGMWALGVLIVRAVLPDAGSFEHIAMGYGLGVGSLTWLLFLLSWVGVPLTVPTILVAFFTLVAGSLLARKLQGKGAFHSPAIVHSDSGSRPGRLDIAGWILLGIFGLVLFVVSVGLSYSMWDAMAIWSVKGYGIALEGSIFAARQWGSKGIAYPLNLPIAISVFYHFDGDLLPGSKLLFPGFFIALLAGLRIYLRRLNLPVLLAWGMVFTVGTVPLFLQYSMVGYANIAFAYYYALGLMWLGIGLSAGDGRRYVVGALLLAFSIWTRLEGLEFWLIAIASLILLWSRQMVSKKTAFGIILPALVIGGSWLLFGWFNHATTGETAVLSNALSRLLHGELHPLAVYQIVRFTGYLVFKARVYGILVPIAIGLSLILTIFSSRARRDRLSMTLLIAGLFTGLGVMFMYYLTSYDPAGLEWWLGTGYDRMLFGAVILLAIASVPILWKTWSQDK